MHVNCKDCRWWSEIPGTSRFGECRRKAPVRTEDMRRAWPETRPEDWCGDGQVKVEED